jgi:hypothetical protein
LFQLSQLTELIQSNGRVTWPHQSKSILSSSFEEDIADVLVGGGGGGRDRLVSYLNATQHFASKRPADQAPTAPCTPTQKGAHVKAGSDPEEIIQETHHM